MIVIKVVIEFGIDSDIIDCPEDIVDNLIEYREQFSNWLFDKKNDHNYWFYIDGKKMGCSYRSEAFVEWLNKFVFYNSSKKAKVLETQAKEWDKELPSICF